MPFQSPRFRHEAAQLAKLAGPIVVAQVAQMMMALIDTVMAGRAGATALAAVALGSGVWAVVFVTMMGVISAVGPFVAHHFGAAEHDRIVHISRQGLWLAGGLGLIAAVLLVVAGPLLRHTGAPEAVVVQATGFLHGIAFGTPAGLLFRSLGFYSASVSRTRPMMILGLAALLLNIPLNYALIYGHWGLPAMGGAGCGWGSGISMWVVLIAMVWHVARSPDYARHQPLRGGERPHVGTLKRLLRLGVPIGAAYLIEVSAFASVGLILARFGAEMVAGHQVVLNFASITFMVPMSVGQALTVRTGQHLGAGDPRAARRACAVALVMVVAFMLLSGSCMGLFGATIASWYTPDVQVAAVATTLFPFAAAFQLSDGLQTCASGGLRGYKSSVLPMFAMLLAFWMVGVPLGILLGLDPAGWIDQPPMGARGFWVGLAVGLTIAATVLVIGLVRVSRRHVREMNASPLPVPA